MCGIIVKFLAIWNYFDFAKVLVFLWFGLGHCKKYEAQLWTIITVNINSNRMKSSQILAVLGFWFCQNLKKISCLQNYDKKITLLNFYHVWKPRISVWNFMMKPIGCIYQWAQRKVIFTKSVTKIWQNNDRFIIVSHKKKENFLITD